MGGEGWLCDSQNTMKQWRLRPTERPPLPEKSCQMSNCIRKNDQLRGGCLLTGCVDEPVVTSSGDFLLGGGCDVKSAVKSMIRSLCHMSLEDSQHALGLSLSERRRVAAAQRFVSVCESGAVYTAGSYESMNCRILSVHLGLVRGHSPHRLTHTLAPYCL